MNKQAEFKLCKHLSKWHIEGLWLVQAKEFLGYTHSHEEIKTWRFCPICGEKLTKEMSNGDA